MHTTQKRIKTLDPLGRLIPAVLVLSIVGVSGSGLWAETDTAAAAEPPPAVIADGGYEANVLPGDAG